MAQRIETQTGQQASTESKFAKRHYVPLVFGWGAGLTAAGVAFVAWKNAALRQLIKTLRQDHEWNMLDRPTTKVAQAIMDQIKEDPDFKGKVTAKNMNTVADIVFQKMRDEQWSKPYGSAYMRKEIHEPYDAFMVQYREFLESRRQIDVPKEVTKMIEDDIIGFEEKAAMIAKKLAEPVERYNMSEYINRTYKKMREWEEIEKHPHLRRAKQEYRDIVDDIVKVMKEGLAGVDAKFRDIIGKILSIDSEIEDELWWQKEKLFKDARQQALEARDEYHKVLDNEVLKRLQKQGTPLEYKNLSQRDQFKTVAFAAVVGIAVGAVVAGFSNWLVSAKYAKQQKMALKMTGIQGATSAAPLSYQDRLELQENASPAKNYQDRLGQENSLVAAAPALAFTR